MGLGLQQLIWFVVGWQCLGCGCEKQIIVSNQHGKYFASACCRRDDEQNSGNFVFVAHLN